MAQRRTRLTRISKEMRELLENIKKNEGLDTLGAASKRLSAEYQKLERLKREQKLLEEEILDKIRKKLPKLGFEFKV